MTLRKSGKWCVNNDLRLADWQEGDAAAYIVGVGDLHVLSGLSLRIVRSLMESSLSFYELANKLEGVVNIDQDPHLLSRQLLQLHTLQLVSECK